MLTLKEWMLRTYGRDWSYREMGNDEYRELYVWERQVKEIIRRRVGGGLNPKFVSDQKVGEIPEELVRFEIPYRFGSGCAYEHGDDYLGSAEEIALVKFHIDRIEYEIQQLERIKSENRE